jgi:hypothetical protein
VSVTTHAKALVLAIVAFGLTVTGVVLAATDSNPTGAAKDLLVLNGYPPSSANLLISLAEGNSSGLSANVLVNFKNNNVDAIIKFPFIVTTAAVEVRLVNDHAYLRSAEVSSGPWLAAPLSTPALFGLALELTKPDIDLITGFSSESHVKNGYSTTYNFVKDHVALSNVLGTSSAASALGTIYWSITVGSQGEVSSSTLLIKTKHTHTKLSVVVESYNKSAHITAPPANDVKVISNKYFSRLFKSKAFSAILIPKDLSELSQSSAS